MHFYVFEVLAILEKVSAQEVSGIKRNSLK